MVHPIRADNRGPHGRHGGGRATVTTAGTGDGAAGCQQPVIRSPPAGHRHHRPIRLIVTTDGSGGAIRLCTRGVSTNPFVYVVPLGTRVIAQVGKIVITEGPQLGKFVIVANTTAGASGASFSGSQGEARHTPLHTHVSAAASPTIYLREET